MNYPGGKGGVFRKLINLMPPHEVYIETHLGAGAIMRKKRPAKINIGIEKDPDVVNLWNIEPQRHFKLICDDAIQYLKRYQFIGNELVYCDPPYLRSTRKKNEKLYRYDSNYDEHMELLCLLKSLPCMVMISGYKSTLYSEMLSSWNSYSYQAACHHGIAIEWVWMNYSTPVELHDYRYLGDTFRDRERIKRRTKRWVSRLQSIPILERQALLHALTTTTTIGQGKERT